jgi:hypothetical protein
MSAVPGEVQTVSIDRLLGGLNHLSLGLALVRDRSCSLTPCLR